MGRGTTHKTQILDLYLSGYQFSKIEQRTHHSETAVKRYIQDFPKIILLHLKDFSVDQIRISTSFSNRLIGEYIKLYNKYKKEDNSRLNAIFNLSKKNFNLKEVSNMITNNLKFIPRDTRDHSNESITERRYQRMKGKSLKNILINRFLHHYGYDKGIANAIVDDILLLVESFYGYSDNSFLKQGQMV